MEQQGRNFSIDSSMWRKRRDTLRKVVRFGNLFFVLGAIFLGMAVACLTYYNPDNHLKNQASNLFGMICIGIGVVLLLFGIMLCAVASKYVPRNERSCCCRRRSSASPNQSRSASTFDNIRRLFVIDDETSMRTFVENSLTQNPPPPNYFDIDIYGDAPPAYDDVVVIPIDTNTDAIPQVHTFGSSGVRSNSSSGDVTLHM